MKPAFRRRLAAVHLVATIPCGAASVLLVATNGYERILMAISWYAITITAADVLATTDVREKSADE